MINGPRATLYYKVLYSILQSTTPVRLLFYKVLLQYDSADIALVRTTNSVLRRSRKYCSILQSTTPVPTTKITTPVLLCTSQISPNAAPATKIDPPTSPNNALACQEKWHSNMTEYCACHEKWHRNSWCGHKRPQIAVTSDQKLRSQATPRPFQSTQVYSQSTKVYSQRYQSRNVYFQSCWERYLIQLFYLHCLGSMLVSFLPNQQMAHALKDVGPVAMR